MKQAISAGIAGNAISKKITGTSEISAGRSAIATGAGALLSSAATGGIAVVAGVAAAPVAVPAAVIGAGVAFIASLWD